MSNLFTEKYGYPTQWRCPDCGINFDLFPALPTNHLCTSQIRYGPEKVYYFPVMNLDADLAELWVANGRSVDPAQYVESVNPDGTLSRWEAKERGEYLIFRGPRGYDPKKGIRWVYDKRLMTPIRMPDDMVRMVAIKNRVSG